MDTPGLVSAPGCGLLSALSGDTTVTSTAKGIPRSMGRPDATISSLRPSPGSTSTPASRMKTFSRTLAPLSRRTRAQALSTGPARSLSKPLRAHAAAWSPSSSSLSAHVAPPARARGQWQRTTQPPSHRQKKPRRCKREGGLRRDGSQPRTCRWPTLRKEESPAAAQEAGTTTSSRKERSTNELA